MKKNIGQYFIYALLLAVIAFQAIKPAPDLVNNADPNRVVVSYDLSHAGDQFPDLNLQPGDSVHITCPSFAVLPNYWKSGRQDFFVKCFNGFMTPTTEPTQESTPIATDTPGAGDTPTPSLTPVVSLTPSQTLTPTPIVPTPTSNGSGSIQPYAGAPACPTHDPNQWHGLWNYELGCHYDHTHGDDPALADSYFGPLGALWDGSTISYPFKSSAAENVLKHAGYKISVRIPSYHPWAPCNSSFHVTDIGNDNCIIASRVEYHAVGGLMDLVGRYHSYWAEFYVCAGHPVPAPSVGDPRCGIVRTGGLLDFAQLQAPHYNARIIRPGGTIDFGNGLTMTYDADGPDLPSHSGEPYVFSYPYTSDYINLYRNNSPHGRGPGTAPGSYSITIDQWSSNDFDCEPRPAGDPCHNQFTHLLFQVGDAFNLVDTQNLNTVRWICYGSTGCEYDGSMIGLNELAVRVMNSWNGAGGFANFIGYTDRWGNPRNDTTCQAPGADCVPFIVDHAPVGVAGVKSNGGCLCDVWEYDIYFNNRPSGWIKFPN